jgi:chromosome segregation ATPase
MHQRQACRLRLQDVQADYEASERARLKAKRQKEIGQAAVPLARVWDARREAARHRELLQQKLNEFAPELQQLIEIATSFANAVEHDATALRGAEQSHRLEAQQCREAADQTREEVSAAGERAAQDEVQVTHLQSQLINAQQEEQLLRGQAVLAPEDRTALDGMGRINQELAAQDMAIASTEQALYRAHEQLAEVSATRAQAELDRTAIEKEQERAQDGWDHAMARRESLEADATLLRLLQTDHVDVEAAATSAATQASDELRRVTDAILRIGVEAAEDERAIHGLNESELLPPTQDVQSLLDWLRQRNVNCWSGWEYFQINVTLKERRAMIRRLPQIAAGVVVANSDYDRVVELFSSGDEDQPTYRSRSPLVVAPADALRDGQEVLWVVVGPTSDAHFDKGAGAQELTRLLAEKSNRQQDVDRYQEWREALTELRHRLQQFHSEYPRGWFSDQRQKLEIVSSRLEEAGQLVLRLSAKQRTLETEAEQARQQIRTLSTSRDRLIRNRDRLEQFDRSFGTLREGWHRELAASRERAEKARRLQAELRQKVGVWEQKAQQALNQVNTAFLQAAQLEAELAKVKHCDAARRKPTAGTTEDLRAQYELLLADYEGKVHADALSRLAEAKDQEAEREDREFQRVLSKLSQFSADEVRAELRQLPEGVTAQQQLEQADTAFYEATRKLGPLANRLKSIKGEFEAADHECQKLSKAVPLPVLAASDSVEGHQAKAAQARQESDEHAQFATAFLAEADAIAQRLTVAAHEADKLEKDHQRLTSIRLSNERQFERLAASTRAAPLIRAIPSVTVNDSATLVIKLDELERSLNQIRDQHETLDTRREAVAKDVSTWSRQERFGKLRSSISHRFLDRDLPSLEAKAEFDIRQLNDCVFQIEEKLKEADQQREIVIHVLSTAVDEALSLLGRVSRMSKLPDSLPQAGKQFLKIETKASENPTERRTYIGELIDELLERGDVGDGLQLVQKAVRRVARRISVRVLHPDLHQQTDRVSIANMRRFSGGERLTSAILLYCALIRLRQGESNRRGGSSVLILDNPIGTASRLSFLDMQREVARAMNVQLIYATAVKDLDAVGALENIIRLRNARADRRTGRHFIEAEDNGIPIMGEIDAARVVFDAAPSSLIQSNRNGANHQRGTADSEVRDDTRHA